MNENEFTEVICELVNLFDERKSKLFSFLSVKDLKLYICFSGCKWHLSDSRKCWGGQCHICYVQWITMCATQHEQLPDTD